MKPIVHEHYNIPKASSNDIALLKLDEEVNMTIYTPLCLPPVNKQYEDQIGYAYGKDTINMSDMLKQYRALTELE